MGLRNFKIWGVFLVAIVIVAFMLFHQSNTNKIELDQQAIRNMELVKGNFQVAFQSYTNQKLQRERRRLLQEDLKKPNEKQRFKKFEDFDFVKVDSVNLVQNNAQDLPFLKLNLASGNYDMISFEELFAKINNQDFFRPVFLTDQDGKILHPQSEIGKTFHHFEETDSDTTLLPTNKKEIIYHDEKHLIYYTPVLIGDYKFYLVGAIKSEDFESIGWKVDFTNLTILVFLLGLMLFSLPIFSFFGLTKGDKLTRFGVFSVGLSFVGILVIVGFGFSFFKNHHPITDKDHEIIRNQIKGSVRNNLIEKLGLLNQWDYSDGKSNDLIRINNFGGVEEIYQNGALDSENQLYRSLRHREYYSHFLDKPINRDLPEFNTSKSRKLYIGSHYSLDNSKLESVISRLTTKEGQTGDNTEKIVEAITFFWKDSLTRYDQKREFLLFKKNGLIIHKSPRIKIAADSLSQLLSSKKWEEVNAIMQSNVNHKDHFEWEIPLYLDGHAFIGSLMMISNDDGLVFDQPLWMLYLKDEHLEHVYSSLITFETTLLLLFYLLMLAFISLANKLNKTKSKGNVLEKFAYNYVYPKKSKVKNFEYLIWFMVIYIFIILYFYHLPSIHFFGIFLVLIIATFHFKVIMYMMLGPNWQKSNPDLTAEENSELVDNSRNKEINRFFWIMGVVVTISFGFLYSLIPFLQFIFFLIWVIGSSIYSFQKRLKLVEKKSERISTLTTKSQRNYRSRMTAFHYIYTSFFIMWIFMIGFVPGYIIYSKVHQYEAKNWEPQKEKKDFESTPNEFWKSYDENRRLFFGSLTNQNALQVKEFIFTDRQVVQPKLDQLELIDFYSLRQPFKNLVEKFLWALGVTLFFLLILALFIWLVYNLTKKIYFLDFDGLLFQTKTSEEVPFNNKVFICGIDSENYPKWIQERIDLKKPEITDCTTNPELKWEESLLPNLKNKNTWIIKNVHCLPDLSLLLDRLPQFINALHGDLVLVICSGISWKELLSELQTQKQKVIFSQIFSSFHFEYVPIDLDPKLKDIFPNDEKASLLIRSRKAYFYNIWSEMSFDEKKVCYYFSVEGFFNFTNKPIISELMQKGVLIRESMDELPKLFDKNFRLFILNNVSEEEKAKFREDENRHGNASAIQIAVFSFILISIALISYFDKNFLDQATTMVTGIIGAFGGLYSLVKNSLPSFGKNKAAV